MDKIITYPNIPYIGPVFNNNRFSPGKSITIKGIPLATGYKFFISLQCGSESESKNDMGLRMTIHLLDAYISLNSLQNGAWGEKLQCSSPIKCSETFALTIICDINQYKIFINDQLYFEFPHRVQCSQITHILIAGDVSVSEISNNRITKTKTVNFDDDDKISIEVPISNSLSTDATLNSQKLLNTTVITSKQNLSPVSLHSNMKLLQVYPVKHSKLRKCCRYFGLIFGAVVIIGVIVIIKFSKRWIK